METTTRKLFKVLGTTDTVGVCHCCGRTDLKKTVVLEVEGAATPTYYGTACAAKAIKWTVKEVNAEVAKIAKDAKAAEKAAELAAARARVAQIQAKHDAEYAARRAERAIYEAEYARQKAERAAAEEARWARINGTSPW